MEVLTSETDSVACSTFTRRVNYSAVKLGAGPWQQLYLEQCTTHKSANICAAINIFPSAFRLSKNKHWVCANFGLPGGAAKWKRCDLLQWQWRVQIVHCCCWGGRPRGSTGKSGAGDALWTISDRPVWQKSVAKGYGVGGAEAIFELVVGADTGGLVVDPHSAETALDQ